MLISCNKLKSHLKNAESIDWLKIWDKFTIRCAEVENVTQKGNDLKDVVSVEIISCKNHPTKEKYHILDVTDGSNTYHILCGAPNVRVGLKCFLVKIGGMVSGFTIEAKKIAGVLSEGMLCSGEELGINDNHDGIYELKEDIKLGVDIHELLPVSDIIVEIDNKSLTNRPDLWGHYGLAREIAAITKHELKPLEIAKIDNNKENLDIQIKNVDICKRYCGLKIENIKNNTTPIEIQLFLKYVGVRSISLIVDLTNYLMLELGQPMHSFDARIVKNIIVDNAQDNEKFITLDNVERNLKKEMLLIKNNKESIAIAGVMGGLNSEIVSDTTSLFLESACFDATSIRKTATALGLRTEASARYEKSLDPEICLLAIKRYVYLLKINNPDLIISSNLTDVYPHPFKEKKVELTKNKLNLYMGFDFNENLAKEILESLGFNVKIEKNKYIVGIPSYRATKDISLDADLIEEISRMYGYENIKPVPLKLDLKFKIYEQSYEEEYKVKSFLANNYHASEVHSYLWYDNDFLKENNIVKKNITIVNKNDNNIIKDNLSLSLLPFVTKNSKFYSNFIMFEIGTVVINNENKKHLAIVITDSDKNIENSYNLAKLIVTDLFKNEKNKPVKFMKTDLQETFLVNNVSKNITLNNKVYGNIAVINPSICGNISKKKSIVTIEIDYEMFESLSKDFIKLKEYSKYQETFLDYTVIMPKNMNYDSLEQILDKYVNENVLNYHLVDIYKEETFNKYTVRLTVGSFDHTLTSKELEYIKETFINNIKNNNLTIVE